MEQILKIMENNLPATQEHSSWGQNNSIQNNFQRADFWNNSFHRGCFSFYLTQKMIPMSFLSILQDGTKTSIIEVYLIPLLWSRVQEQYGGRHGTC